MNVSLGALDMVVQVVPEQVDQVDGVIPGVLVRVTREEDKGDVPDAVTNSCIRPLQTAWRIPAEQNLGSCSTCATAFFKLLKMNKNTIGI